MRKNIIYALMATGLLASCSDNTESMETFLNGTSKTPIAVRTSLGEAPLSRAYDKTFENGDKLYAYIEAGTLSEDVFTSEGQFIWNDAFTVNRDITTDTDEGVGNITSTESTTDLPPDIYWDDFSSTTYDLRATEVNRGIRVKYGYCYNGGDAYATDKDAEAGTLTWNIPTDQSASDGSVMKKSDLLYAKTEDMVKYKDAQGKLGELEIHYTHAMSKVTINVNVTTGDGFSSDKANFKDAVLTLKNMQIKNVVNAPAATVTAFSTNGTDDIKTYNKSNENTKATYQAIIGPTNLSVGNVLAHIADVDGNYYDIPVTKGILEAWSAHLVSSSEDIDTPTAHAKSRAGEDINPGQGYTTKQGVHYLLDVTVHKQKITVRATITDWNAVSATGVSQIKFANDVTGKEPITNSLLQAAGFDVYKSSDNTSFPETRTTSVTYADGKWTYSPVIYWQGQSDASFFRAVSPAGNSSSEVAQGTDLIWGTSGDDAITPRTGDVLLNFKHLMSKLCVKLETSSSDAAKVDLTGATVKITNLAKAATYDIVNGTVTAGDKAEVMIEGLVPGTSEFVIPQTIGDDAKLIVTLADGTTYSLQLNQCVVTGTETAVSAWASGKNYTYNIYLEKEKITFRALVEDWTEATGSGSAILEWD